MLYVPLGIVWPGDRSRIRSFSYVIAAGAALSMIGETTQLASLSRFPARTYVACNAMGTALGSLVPLLASDGAAVDLRRLAFRSLPCVDVWRRERDSNPRYPSGYSGFQDHRHRPLGHPSA